MDKKVFKVNYSAKLFTTKGSIIIIRFYNNNNNNNRPFTHQKKRFDTFYRLTNIAG